MKGKSKGLVLVEKGLFERRKAEKQKARDEDRRALESGQKSREQLRQENGLFSGVRVRVRLDKARALCRELPGKLATQDGRVLRFVGPNICGPTFCDMTSTATKISELLQLAGSGPLRTRDVDAAGIPRVYLQRLCERGLLERVDRGLYRLPEAPVTELHSLAEVSRRVPHATIALLSALQANGLTTEAPHAVWILIDRHARAPKVTSPKLEVVYASGAALAHGVETRTIEGVPVRLTTPAKTVADCFRYRKHVGLDVALAALRGYLRRPAGKGAATRAGSPIDDLVAAAGADRVSSVLRPYLEALA